MRQLLQALLAARHTNVPGVTTAVLQFGRFESALKQDFFALAAQSGKPRGLRWISCEWPGPVQIVADDTSLLISAFVSINLGFEAVEGGDMEDVEAVSTIRDGSAVFHFQEGSWGSAGRVIFNMNPEQAASHLTPDARRVFDRP